MRFFPRFGCSAAPVGDSATQASSPAPAEAIEAPVAEESGLLKTIGWISAALGAVAIGLIVGREIRQRYKFNRRTPYDLYAHSGDEVSDMSDIEFGVGI
jgi:hypothetical protein